MSRCKGCGAEITFVRTKDGKWMPGDAYGYYSSASGGSVVLSSGEVVQAKDLKKSIKAYRPHWASCPAMAQFKKKESAL